jgi:hypothetical protein
MLICRLRPGEGWKKNKAPQEGENTTILVAT